MLWLKNSALIAITLLSSGAFCSGFIATTFISDAFSQNVKAGIGLSAFALLFGVFGAAVFARVCKAWWDLHWLKNYGLEAKGIVIHKNMPSGEKPLYEFYMDYKFTDREGREYQGRVTIPGPIGLPWSEGHEVNVLYDPDNPKRNVATERWLKIGEG